MTHDQAYLQVLRVKWIFDPAFHYTPSYATDLRKTFERIRRELQSRDRGAWRRLGENAWRARDNVLRLAPDIMAVSQPITREELGS